MPKIKAPSLGEMAVELKEALAKRPEGYIHGVETTEILRCMEEKMKAMSDRIWKDDAIGIEERMCPTGLAALLSELKDMLKELKDSLR